MPYRFKCSKCDDWHEGWPDVAYDEPDYTVGIAGPEREKHVLLSSDLCALDEEFFFIRCRLLVKVRGTGEDFGWGVWSSLSKENFKRYYASYDQDMSDWEPVFGYLSNRLPHYPDTLNLKLSVQTGARGARPTVLLEPTDHPLAIDQRDGISLEKLLEIVGPHLAH
jgi:hypothetical protein